MRKLAGSEDKRKKKLNSAQRRALKSADLRLFAKEYGRKAQRGQDPNDRSYSRDIEKEVKAMKPEKLDKLLRDVDDEE